MTAAMTEERIRGIGENGRGGRSKMTIPRPRAAASFMYVAGVQVLVKEVILF
jgi:hypothetical protein